MFKFTDIFNNDNNGQTTDVANQPINVMAEAPAFFEFDVQPQSKEEGDFQVNRTEKQKTNLVSYDIGVVSGSRKELATLKKAYLESKNREKLSEIAEIDDLLATELATKKNILSWFSLESCKARKVEVAAAYGMHLLIRRFPADSKGMNREQYLNAIEFVSDELYRVQTLSQFIYTVERWGYIVANEATLERYQSRLEFCQKEIDLEIAEPESMRRKGNIKAYSKRVAEFDGMIRSAEYRALYPLHVLSDFTAFLANSRSCSKLYRTAREKYNSWEDYDKAMKEKAEKKGERKGPTVKKSVWERELPVNPIRISPVETPTIMIPEDYVGAFKFRANQMGHWMKDSDALGHLRSSASGFTDLAHILDIPLEAVSNKGTLAMAFGARGIGRALAHFERGKQRNVINMTKKNGGLGVLSHEWLHSFDYHLRTSLSDGNPYDEMLSDMSDEAVNLMPTELYLALENLLNAMKEGECTDYYYVDTDKYSVTPNSHTREAFALAKYDMQTYVDVRMMAIDLHNEKLVNSYVSETSRERARKKYERSRKEALKKTCYIAAALHKEHTGEEIILVPYTIPQSEFYTNAKRLDGKRKPYWSTNVELMARGFEAYIQCKLDEKGMRNDYLVAGAFGMPYPKGEELERICSAYDHFIKVARPYLLD